MLNIPEEVKTLYRQPGADKNLRIHFPNGEREDITNDNLVEESFSFTESICSRDTLKFGLCEASMVEFETVGVGNIKGCEIEVTLEIQNSYRWESIPIGTYTVDSCERQADLNQRKVVAYSLDFSMQVKISEFERMKQASYSRVNKPYNYQLIPYLYNNINGLKDEFVTQKTLVESGEEVKMYQLKMRNEFYYEEGTEEIYNEVSFFGKIYNFYYNKTYDAQEILGAKFSPDKLYNCITSKNTDIESAFGEIENFFNAFDVTFNNKINPAMYSSKYSGKLKEYLKKPHMYMEQGIKDIVSEVHFFSHIKDAYSSDNEYNFYFYPQIDNYENNSDDTAYMYFFIPTRMHVDKYINNNLETSIDYEMYSGNLFECSIIECINPIRKIERNAKYFRGFPLYRVTKEENLKDLLEPFLELNGLFGSVGRDGNFKMISLNSAIGLYPSETLYPADNLYPAGTDILLTKSMYKTAWYDDFYTLLYSKVTCTYKDSATQENTYAEHIIVEVEEGEEDKYQTYDISDNYLIKESIFTEVQIAEILANIASNIDRIRYMPADIDLRGLPYLEAGDVVRVLTTDGGFETIILRRTLTGIQALSDNFESRG